MGGSLIIEHELRGRAALVAAGDLFLILRAGPEAVVVERCDAPSFAPQPIHGLPPLTVAAMAATGGRLAILTAHQRIAIHDLWPAGSCSPVAEHRTGASTYALALGHGGALLATVATEAVAVHDLDLGVVVRAAAVTSRVAAVAFNPDGSHLAVADGRTLRLVPLSNHVSTKAFDVPTTIIDLGFAADGQWLWTLTTAGLAIFAWHDVDTARAPAPPQPRRERPDVTAAASARHIVCCDRAGVLSRIDPLSGQATELLRLPTPSPVRALALSADGQHVAAMLAVDEERSRLLIARADGSPPSPATPAADEDAAPP